MVPWFEGRSLSDNAPIWFSEPTLYIVDPSEGTPTPAPSPTATATPSPSPTPNPSATATPTPAPSPTEIPRFPATPHPPTVTPFISQAQSATNNVFTNVYIALGILVVSTLIAGCYVIIIALNNQGENLRFGVGICLTSLVELTVGVVIVSAFQNSMGTVAIILNLLRG
jgi:hypothetical protein